MDDKFHLERSHEALVELGPYLGLDEVVVLPADGGDLTRAIENSIYC